MMRSALDGSTWDRMKELFAATFELDPDERRRVLDDLVGVDQELRRRIEQLLTAHDGSDGPLDQPAIAALEGVAAALLRPPASLIGRSLGPYRVVREIARGGMGTVYEGARQDAQFARRVAIKTILVGAHNDLALRRFHQERQILAGLQHPHIAALYDGGVTADGLPYFVLEYVDGQPIDVYCAEHRLSLAARLDLFRQVIDAVQYAHRQLVVHRDLKPSNILVTNDGVVKLLDFGIAKLLETDRGEATIDVLVPLTMAYASPEQVRGEPITTAADVYSLGAVLYRLLTGKNPLPVDQLSLERAIATITQELPKPPSAVVGPDTGAVLGIESPERWRRALRSDLDAIVLNALRKEPERRYATAQAFADDLRSYLRGLPVAAAPDTVGYRFQKFVRRRRAIVAATAITIVALIGGSGIALSQARVARREAVKATRVSEFLQGILGARLGGVLGASQRLSQENLTLDVVLDSAARRLSSELESEPETRALLHRTIGMGYLQAQKLEPAAMHLDSALAIHRRTVGENDIEVARDLVFKSALLAETRPDSAEAVARRASALYARQRVDTAGEQVSALYVLATAQSYQAKLVAAETTFVDIINVERRRARPRPEALGMALSALGYLLHNRGMLDSAEATMRHGIAVLDSAGKGPSAEQAGWLMTLGTHLMSKGKAADALPVLQRAQAMARTTIPAGNPVHLQIGISIADALAGLGRVPQSDSAARAAFALVPSLPKGSELHRFTAEWTYTRMLRRQGRLAEAETAARTQFESGMAHAAPYPYYIADAYHLLGGVLSDRGKYAEAEKHLRAAHATATAALGAENTRSKRAARELAQLYLRWQKTAAAEPFLAQLTPAVADSVRANVARERTATRR